jgi:6-pyruvoyltetrahydropterin/6-carboxytetrahydropterin synthase
MFVLRKEFLFEAAHRLAPPYQGPCSHLHGHSWKVAVEITGDDLDARAMVVDFSDLKPIRQWIMDHLDHATLVSSQDAPLLEWLRRNQQKHCMVEVNPTSEAIAKLVFEAVREMGFHPSRVEISETCTSSVQYSI